MFSPFAGLISARFYIYWVEIFVILGILIYFAYLAYSLKLFKKN